jgi:hypothetical protein
VAITAKDLAGNNMKAPYTFSFTTSPLQDLSPPYIITTVPARDTTDVAITTEIVIKWSESMDKASAETAFSSSPAISCTWSWDGLNQICIPKASLEPGTNYTISIDSTALDISGNHLLIPYLFSFTTKGTLNDGNKTLITLYATSIVVLIAVLLVVTIIILKKKKQSSEKAKPKVAKTKENAAIEVEKEVTRIEKKQIKSKKEVVENIRKRRERATNANVKKRNS